MNQNWHNIEIDGIQQKGSNGAQLWSKLLKLTPKTNKTIQLQMKTHDKSQQPPKSGMTQISKLS